MPKKNSKYMNGNGSGANCSYCRRILQPTWANSILRATRDHVIPKHMGGTYRVWCCLQCNQLKAGMTIREWEFFMKHNPEWWLRPENARKVQSMAAKLKSSQEFYAEYQNRL